MGLSEAFAQVDWVRALWSELVLIGAGTESARMARTKRSATSHIGHGLKGQLRSLAHLAIIRKDLSRLQMFLRWIDGKAQVADALTKLHGDGDLLRAVCRQAFTVLIEAPEIISARRQERRVPRVKSPSKLREPVGEMLMPVKQMQTVPWPETRF